LAFVASTYGWGRLSYYVSSADKITVFKLLFVVQLCWILSIALIRISVAISLLRLTVANLAAGYEKLWRGALWTMISIQVLTYAGWMILLLFNCRPLRSSWEPVSEKVCWDQKYTNVYGLVGNSKCLNTIHDLKLIEIALVILMDFFLATMPIKLIWTLNRSFREKVLIACLMAMGLLATGTAAYKMYISKHFFQGDFLQTSVRFSLWNKLEQLVGIIAACAPSLKSPVEKLLRRWGILSEKHSGGFTRPSFVISCKDQTPANPVDAQRNRGAVIDLEIGPRSEAGSVNTAHQGWESDTTEVKATKSTTGSF
jgi:hypothetical protein